MIDETEITLCEPAPFLFHENGQIAVTDGSTVWLVIVTCEAIKATAENSSTADPVCRVLPRPGCSRDRQGGRCRWKSVGHRGDGNVLETASYEFT